MRSTLPMLAVVVSFFATSSHAQNTNPWIDRNPEASFAFTPPEAPHRHSSTYQEGVQRGYATVIRAAADYNLQDAQGQILREQAYAMSLDNWLKKTIIHFDRKRIIANAYHQERLDRYARKEELRELKRIDQLREALDNPLSEYDVDFSTGSVYWPALVAGPRYSHYRRELDRLASSVLTRNSTATEVDREALISLCNKLRFELNKDLQAHTAKDLSSVQAEYAAADRLLRGLRYAPVIMAEVPVQLLSMN